MSGGRPKGAMTPQKKEQFKLALKATYIKKFGSEKEYRKWMGEIGAEGGKVSRK